MLVDKNKIYISNGYSFKNYVMLSEEESHTIWQWRNDNRVRCWMLHSEVIPLENHLKFVQSLSNRYDCYYWMVFREDKPVGAVYLQDVESCKGDFGYYANPDLKGEGFGLVKEGLNFVLNVLGLEKIVLSVDENNKLAIALDKFLGFYFNRVETVEGRNYKWCDHYDKEIIISKYNLTRDDYSKYIHSLANNGFFD